MIITSNIFNNVIEAKQYLQTQALHFIHYVFRKKLRNL